MPNLFTWFQNYLNPSKLTAVTVPGMVVAFALILILGPIPCRNNTKTCPFCSSSLQPSPSDGVQSTPKTPGTGSRASGPTTPGPTTSPSPTSGAKTIYARVSRTTLKQETTTGDIDSLIDSLKNVEPQPPNARTATELNKRENALADSIAKIGDNCNNVPSYVVPNSTLVLSGPDDKDYKKESDAADKKAQELRPLIEPAPPKESKEPLQTSLNKCNSKLQSINAVLSEKSTYLDKFISQGFTDLSGLSTALVAAQQGGDELVAKSISAKLQEKREFLSWAQQEQAIVKNIGASLSTLQSRVQVMLNVVIAPVPDSKPTPNVATDVFQTIQENLLKFLLFSLILGQILDPIQRGAVSFFGPRRNFFGAFNKVYGQRGDGEFRYGDRRLEPWVSNDATGEIDHRKTSVIIAELRPNAAGKAFEKDRNIYDKNYAIGAGYVSQSEVKVIEDEYFAQSQITSGLIIPMLLLSVCVALRMICCSPVASVASNSSANFFLAAAAISAGIIAGIGIMILTLLLSSRKYWTIFGQGARELRRKVTEVLTGSHPKEPSRVFRTEEDRADWKKAEAEASLSKSRLGFFAAIVVALLIVWIWALVILLGGNPAVGLDSSDLMLIGLPVVLIGPLWIAGLDRLHKYYSELEARIAGNILRLQDNTEKKILDIISDPDAAAALTSRITDTVDGEQKLANFLATVLDDTSPDSPASSGGAPPSTPAVPTQAGQPPAPASGGGGV